MKLLNRSIRVSLPFKDVVQNHNKGRLIKSIYVFLIYIHYPKHIQFHIIFKKDKAILQQTNNRGKSYLVRDYYIRLTKFIKK